MPGNAVDVDGVKIEGGTRQPITAISGTVVAENFVAREAINRGRVGQSGSKSAVPGYQQGEYSKNQAPEWNSAF